MVKTTRIFSHIARSVLFARGIRAAALPCFARLTGAAERFGVRPNSSGPRRFGPGHVGLGCRLYFLRFILFFTTGAGPGNTTASAPAFSILASALALKRWAEIFSFLVNSPL